jgi:hypothetical protein
MTQVIKIKRSTANTAPASLANGELAYSAVVGESHKLFIGRPGGTSGDIDAIGGKYYTDIVDAATNANTVSTLVKRDGSGNFSAGTITANLTGDASGNAGTATTLETSRDFSVSGDATTASAVSFNGSQNVDLAITLANSGVVAGTYGSTTAIPVVVVDAKGRITSISTESISTDLGIAGDTGTDSIALSTDTLTFEGGTGVTTTVDAALDKVSFAIGQDVGTTANVSFDTVTADLVGNVTGDVTGDLTGDVTGNVTGDLTGNVTGDVTGNVTGDLTGDVTGTVSDISNHSTTNLSEGTNLYFTDTRARDAISVTDAGGDGSLSYNSATGVITYTGPSATEVRAHFSGGTGVNIASGVVSIGQNVATNANVTFNNITVDGTLSTDDLTAATVTTSGNVIVQGNLTVNGTTTTVNSNEVNIGDSIILLNSDEAGTPSENGGIELERGTSPNVQVLWNEASDRWGFTNDGSTYFNLPLSTEYDNYGHWTVTDGSTSTNVTSSSTVTFAGTNLSVAESSGTITYSVATATTTVLGIASFDTNFFTVTAGAVTLSNVDGGTF